MEAAGLLGETVDPVAVLIANTSAMLGCDAVFNNSENKSVFWTPTPYAGTRGCVQQRCLPPHSRIAVA